MIATQNDYLTRESALKRVQKADDFAALLATIHVVAHEQIARLHGDDTITLELILVLLLHFLEHVKQVSVLTVNITKDLDGRLELDECLLVLEDFLGTLNQKLDHFTWQVNNGYILGVLGLVRDNIIIQIVDDDVHDEHGLLLHELLGNDRGGFLELTTPFLSDFECL